MEMQKKLEVVRGFLKENMHALVFITEFYEKQRNHVKMSDLKWVQDDLKRNMAIIKCMDIPSENVHVLLNST